MKRFLSLAGIEPRHAFPTDAIVTKNGHIMDQDGSLLNKDIYGSSNAETYLPKTVSIMLTYNPGWVTASFLMINPCLIKCQNFDLIKKIS